MTDDIDHLAHVRPFAGKVEALAGFGISAGDIACVLGLDEGELTRDYGSEFACGGIKANARVAESLFRKATGEGYGAVTAAIFWLKTRARWKETSVSELAPGTEGAITVRIVRFGEES
jgi:hypothetical protein